LQEQLLASHACFSFEQQPASFLQHDPADESHASFITHAFSESHACLLAGGLDIANTKDAVAATTVNTTCFFIGPFL
jgi:phosphoribosylanthranilate isomerase